MATHKGNVIHYFSWILRKVELRKVVIDKVKSHQNNTWPGSIFSNLPALEVLEIQTALEYGEGTTKGKLGFSADLFKNNKRLKVVIIKRENRSDEDVTIAIPENWFDNNPLLEEIRFEDWTFDIPRGTFTKLHNLTELQLSEQRIAGDHLKHRIALSKLDFTHFKRHKRGNLQYDGTEWRGVSVHRSWRSIVKNPPTPTTSGYAQR